MSPTKYKNTLGLVLYSQNPFVIKRLPDICNFISGDRLRSEIIITKYLYSKLSVAQQEVFKRIATGKFSIQREYNENFNFHLYRESEAAAPVWIATDSENDIEFHVTPTKIVVKSSDPSNKNIDIVFEENHNLSKLFYFLCECVVDKNNNVGKIVEQQAKFELTSRINELYQR